MSSEDNDYDERQDTSNLADYINEDQRPHIRQNPNIRAES